MVKINNDRYLDLYKTKLSNNRDDFKKLDWVSEQQMLCRFVMAERVIDFSKVNSWIDLGCGTGDFFQYILSKHPVARVIGLDATDQFVSISKEKNKDYKVDYVVDNIMTYKSAELYDLVSLSGILQLLDFDKIDDVFTILASLVKPGGQIWIDTLNYDYENMRRKNSLWRFKQDELIDLLKKHDFSNVVSNAFNEAVEITDSEDSFLRYLYGVKNDTDLRVSQVAIQHSVTNPKPTISETAPGIKIPNKLQDLNLVRLADQSRFLEAAEAGKQTSWLYFFPFLYCFSKGRTQTLLWEQIDNSICLYLLRQIEGGMKLWLYLPPFPFSLTALKRAEDRLQQFNSDNSCNLLWLEEAQRSDFEKLDYRIRFVEDEYIYATQLVVASAGKQFDRLRKKSNRISRLPNIEIRNYQPEDKEKCLNLLESWRNTLENEKGIKIGGYRYARNILKYAGDFDGVVLKSQVVVIDGHIRAFTFGGKITSTHGSIFISISDHAVEGLGYLQRREFIKANHLPFFNDSSDAGREGLSYVKNAFRPVVKNRLYRAKLR